MQRTEGPGSSAAAVPTAGAAALEKGAGAGRFHRLVAAKFVQLCCCPAVRQPFGQMTISQGLEAVKKSCMVRYNAGR
jgi:hypothetical protein